MLSKLYETLSLIAFEKHKDLVILLKYMPPVHYPFFLGIRHCNGSAVQNYLNKDELLDFSEDEEFSDNLLSDEVRKGHEARTNDDNAVPSKPSKMSQQSRMPKKIK